MQTVRKLSISISSYILCRKGLKLVHHVCFTSTTTLTTAQAGHTHNYALVLLRQHEIWWAILQLLIKWVQDVSSCGSLSSATGDKGDKEPWLKTSCTHLIRSCSIAHQISCCINKRSYESRATESLLRQLFCRRDCLGEPRTQTALWQARRRGIRSDSGAPEA